LNFFKPTKQNAYLVALQGFLEQSASLMLFWLKQTNGTHVHLEAQGIRNALIKAVEFYEQVILSMCLYDLDILFPRFIKRMKRVVYE
jgi:hypothetical protein